MKVSVIVLTMGDRPAELDALVRSLEGQSFEGVLVGNGEPSPTYRGWRNVDLPDNVGISGGRRIGAEHATGDVLVFIDDDASVVTPDLLSQVVEAMSTQPDLGAIALRVVIEGTNRSPSEWLPRIRGARPLEAGDVTAFHGAAHAVRASVYHAIGGYPESFWYSHEETDLAWRILNEGMRIEYQPHLILEHPDTKPSRHPQHLWYSARNRVWLARRNLRIPVALLYASLWLAIQLLRTRSADDVRAVLKGTLAGMTQSCEPCKPLTAATMWRMTLAGRPPLI